MERRLIALDVENLFILLNRSRRSVKLITRVVCGAQSVVITWTPRGLQNGKEVRFAIDVTESYTDRKVTDMHCLAKQAANTKEER